MLSISAMASGQESYYLELAKEDYYLEGGEPQGHWLGAGARALDLSGTISKEAFSNLFAGQTPDGMAPLSQRQGYHDGRKRQPGWDLTFSAPKSVSAFWALSDAPTREAIHEAHHAAVTEALRYLEQDAGFTRRGQGGVQAERLEGLVVGAFEHGTSRAGDPQLHTHALVMNVGLRTDGSWGTIRSRDLYQHKMAAGVLYRSELAHGLAARLGLRMSPLRGWFELNGVPREIIEAFSTRRAEIEARLVAQGRSGARASEQAALHTRQRKGHFSREALFSAWRQMGEELRFSSAMAAALIAKPYVPDWNQSVGALEAAFPKALRELTGRLAHFGERDLVRSMAERVQARGLPSKVIRSFVRTRLKDRQVVALGEEMGYERFSTRSVYALETKLLEVARRSVGEGRHIVSERSLAWALSKHSTLTSEQASAVRKITAEQGSIQCLRGLAGTGKTFALGAAREAWERQGYRVVGVTLSARAARALQAGSKIESTTIASSLFRSSPSLSYILKHHGRQLVRAALKKPTYKLIRPKLDSKTVLVIDEASMVGTKDMYALLVAAAKGRAKVVLVGDDRQLQAIEGSGPYRALMKALGTAELTQITRQREPWMARAVRQFAEGDARGALSEYARRERIHLEDTPDETRERLVRDWSERRTKRLSGTLILAGTREAVTDVNARVQKARIAGGELRPSKSVQASRGKRFYEGDRVLFTKNNARLGVHNGDFGTIEKVSRRFPNRASRLTIRLDEVDDSQGLPIPIRVTIECRDAEHLDLGYAVTVHKAQGATVEQTFVLGGGWMQDRELAYVQMSRARGRTDIYATHGDAGEDLSELVRAMERSRPKELAHEVQTRGLVSARSQTRRLRR